ncbi:MAG TPA: serine/threonine-protein kinase [Gemmataceae bacterium]|jgi:serine/threonine protein kinase/WD40 repeat protein
MEPKGIDRLFWEAAHIASKVEREAYLDRVCGENDALRRRLLQLLDALPRAEHFLESSADILPATVDELLGSEVPRTILGPFRLLEQIGEVGCAEPVKPVSESNRTYKLLEQIGEGGFGIVFLAEQQQPIRRRVALKILKPGMDSRQIIARFEAERQALALMDHPNIARVFDAGTTDSGRPYFVMELVRGVPIIEYCDQHSLPPRERLELFLCVCQAVQHAHQKGIIHRDIKPSNVLVTRHDGTPVVKVIDFGIAKALGQSLTDKTLCTGFAQLIGTPLYMSPEQTEMSGLDIDTRTDIYSLGVVLYELLTGTTPFDKERLRQVGYDEMRRIIREEEPPTPSTRMSMPWQTGIRVSAQRQSDAKQLSQLLRGELDWIVMKALEKDRNRRYETAAAFAADVQRYLHDEAVQACPPSASYRLRKFLRRNRGPVLAAAAVLLALIGGIVGTTIGLVGAEQARRAAEVAQAKEHMQRQVAERAEHDKTLKLWQAQLAQARATRRSRGMGQRFETLEVLKQATQLARELYLPRERFLDLQNEAIACLALPDVRVAQEWEGWPAGSAYLDFDAALERYVRTDRAGGVNICRVGDGALLAHFTSGLKKPWPQLSPDGRFLALRASSRCELWKLDGPKPTPLAPQQDCAAIDFSPNGQRAALVHPDGTIRLYDLAGNRPVRLLKAGPHPVAFVAFHPDSRRLALSHGGGVQIRDLNSEEAANDLPQAGAERLAWHPQGRMLAIVSSDLAIHIWDVAARREIRALRRWKNGGLRIVFNHTGDLLASYGWEHMLRLWDPRTGMEVFHTPARFDGASLRFMADDRFLAADIQDHKLRLWEIALGQECRRLIANPSQGKAPFGPFAVHPDGRILAACTPDGFGLWDVVTEEQLLTPIRMRSLDNVLFEPSGALLTAGPSGIFRWPLQPDPASAGALRLGPSRRLALPATSRTQIACSLDGRALASADGEGGWVLHSDLPRQPVRLTPHEDARAIAISPDGRWVVTGSQHGSGAKLWDARTGRLEKELLSDEGRVRVRFSPDGRWLAARGNGLQLWAVGSWQEGPFLGGIPDAAFAFSPIENVLAMETGHGTLRLVNPETGREYARLEEPDQVRSAWICFSPDGTQLLTAGAGSGAWIRVWDLRAIRRQLASMGLDWDLPPYPLATALNAASPLRVIVDRGDLPDQPMPRDKEGSPGH